MARLSDAFQLFEGSDLLICQVRLYLLQQSNFEQIPFLVNPYRSTKHSIQKRG